ncbi:hypothetical protein POG22_16725 [Geitlerinema sp. CS-897]|nr:hypothetical protein [Geitlerinema sp. CS-897]
MILLPYIDTIKRNNINSQQKQMSVKTLFLILAGLAFINLGIAMLDLQLFVSKTRSIQNWNTLKYFKTVIRRHMYQTLIQIGLLSLLNILGIYGIITGKLSLVFVLIV